MKMEYIPAPEFQICSWVIPMKYAPDPQPELTLAQLAENAEFCAVADDNRARGWSNE